MRSLQVFVYKRYTIIDPETQGRGGARVFWGLCVKSMADFRMLRHLSQESYNTKYHAVICHGELWWTLYNGASWNCHLEVSRSISLAPLLHPEPIQMALSAWETSITYRMAKKKAKDNAKAPVCYYITFILVCIFIYQLDWYVLLRMPMRNGLTILYLRWQSPNVWLGVICGARYQCGCIWDRRAIYCNDYWHTKSQWHSQQYWFNSCWTSFITTCAVSGVPSSKVGMQSVKCIIEFIWQTTWMCQLRLQDSEPLMKCMCPGCDLKVHVWLHIQRVRTCGCIVVAVWCVGNGWCW